MVTSAILSWIKVASALSFWISHMINLETVRCFLSCAVPTGQWRQDVLGLVLPLNTVVISLNQKVSSRWLFKEKWEIRVGWSENLGLPESIQFALTVLFMESASEQSSVLFLEFRLCVCWERFYQPLASQSLTLAVRSPIQIPWASSFIQRCDLIKLFKSELKFQSWWWVLALCKAHHRLTQSLDECWSCARPTVPPNIHLDYYFFDEKKEKIKMCVCMLNRRK